MLMVLADIADRVTNGMLDATALVPPDRIAPPQRLGQGQGHAGAVPAICVRNRNPGG